MLLVYNSEYCLKIFGKKIVKIYRKVMKRGGIKMKIQYLGTGNNSVGVKWSEWECVINTSFIAAKFKFSLSDKE